MSIFSVCILQIGHVERIKTKKNIKIVVRRHKLKVPNVRSVLRWESDIKFGLQNYILTI
jgi:hypothetical protein